MSKYILILVYTVIIVMFPWKTVGMIDPSSSSLATYAQLVDDCLRMDSSRPALMILLPLGVPV